MSGPDADARPKPAAAAPTATVSATSEPRPEAPPAPPSPDELAGSWTAEKEWDGTFTGSGNAYHGKSRSTLQLSRSGSGLSASFREERLLQAIGPAAGVLTRTYIAVFQLRLERDALSGVSTSAKSHDSPGGANESYPYALFTGAVLPGGGGIDYQIVWRRDESGNGIENTTGTLRRPTRE